MIHIEAKSAAAAGVAAAIAAISHADEETAVHCRFCDHVSYITACDPKVAEHMQATHLRQVHADLVEKYPSLT